MTECQHVNANGADSDGDEVFALELREHGEDHLHDQAEVGELEPWNASVPRMLSDAPRVAVQGLLELLLLLVVLSVAYGLILHVFLVLIGESLATLVNRSVIQNHLEGCRQAVQIPFNIIKLL